MPKKSYTLRDFGKGLNTHSSPRDVDDKNLTRSVGATSERPGILRPLGKANSLSGSGEYYAFKDDNDSFVSTDAIQDPGHGLYSFSYGFNHGERSTIKKCVSDNTATDDNTYVEISDSIGTGENDINFAVGDIVRIYGKKSSTELNNRYFEVSKIDTSNKRVHIKVRDDENGETDAMNFMLDDESGMRLAREVVDTSATLSSSCNSSTTQLSVNVRKFAAKGDFIMINQEVMEVTSAEYSYINGKLCS